MTITAAFNIIQGDPDVKSILINIFGGIMRCDEFAEDIFAGALCMYMYMYMSVAILAQL